MSEGNSYLARSRIGKNQKSGQSHQYKSIGWISNHPLTAEQIDLIAELHPGKEIIEIRSCDFRDRRGLKNFLLRHPDIFFYVIAGKVHLIEAVICGMEGGGLSFGLFVRERRDNSGTISSVVHFNGRERRLTVVWDRKTRIAVI